MQGRGKQPYCAFSRFTSDVNFKKQIHRSKIDTLEFFKIECNRKFIGCFFDRAIKHSKIYTFFLCTILILFLNNIQSCAEL